MKMNNLLLLYAFIVKLDLLEIILSMLFSLKYKTK